MKLKNIFKRRDTDHPYNIYHPDIANKIEFAFECGPAFGKRKFYRFKADENSTSEFEQRVGRYMWYDAYLDQARRKMDDRTIEAFMDKLEKCLGGAAGQVQLGEAFKIIHTIRALTKMAFDPATIKKLASVTYFDDCEDLRYYDQAYNKKKIEFWEKHNVYDFFLSSPIADLFNLRGISEDVLLNYIQERGEIIKELTYVTRIQSSENH